MPVYLLTIPQTYSRAVVVARDEAAARSNRPDGAIWRHGAWYALKRTGSGWHKSLELRPAAQLETWPCAAHDVEVTLLAAHEDRTAAEDVVCFEPSVEPRPTR